MVQDEDPPPADPIVKVLPASISTTTSPDAMDETVEEEEQYLITPAPTIPDRTSFHISASNRHEY